MELFKKIFRANAFTTGLAMFAMFFGSGNLIFPVALGQVTGSNVGWALLGLFFTAILMPFFTVCLMLLLNGDYERFFGKIGVVPGRIIAYVIMGLVGPFGVLPRCVGFSYSTLSLYVDSISLPVFALASCLLILALSYKESDIVGIIGNILTPVLILSLIIIIYVGLSAAPIPLPEPENVSRWSVIGEGFIEGYKTFDIFAALFFATAIIPAFRKVLGNRLDTCKKSLLSLAIRSSLVGMFLLFGVYAGLSFVASNLRGGLIGVPGDQMLGVISTLTMGPTAGLMSNLIVMLACLTTAISLAAVSAEFFSRTVFNHRIGYKKSLILTMAIAFVFSLMGFTGIMSFVLPILMVICPAVIVLVVLNTLHFWLGYRWIKVPFYMVLSGSFLMTLFA